MHISQNDHIKANTVLYSVAKYVLVPSFCFNVQNNLRAGTLYGKIV